MGPQEPWHPNLACALAAIASVSKRIQLANAWKGERSGWAPFGQGIRAHARQSARPIEREPGATSFKVLHGRPRSSSPGGSVIRRRLRVQSGRGDGLLHLASTLVLRPARALRPNGGKTGGLAVTASRSYSSECPATKPFARNTSLLEPRLPCSWEGR